MIKKLKQTNVPNTDLQIYECPCECGFENIEIGKDQESFMALFEAPYQYLRCGRCGFGEKKDFKDLSHNITDAVIRWNKLVEASLEIQ